MENTSSMIAVIIAFISALAAVSGGVFTYKASTKQTKGEVETKRIDQVLEGMQKIIDNLGAENKRLATELDKLRDQLFVVKEDLNKSEVERIKALKDLGVLEERYQNLKNSLQNKHVINGESEMV